MKRAVTTSQYRALNQLRGLPYEAHMLLMTSTPTPRGGLLDGPRAAFTELIEHIGEDISAGMHSAAVTRELVAFCHKIDPSSRDWLGM